MNKQLVSSYGTLWARNKQNIYRSWQTRQQDNPTSTQQESRTVLGPLFLVRYPGQEIRGGC